ncbi:MAG: nucleotidyltransferase family protein, partial [Ignavibacterium sp.]
MKELTSEQKLLLEIAKNIENYEKFWPSEELLENIDWEYFLQLSKRHKVSPIVYKFIYR